MNLKIETVEDILKTAHLYKLTEVLKMAIKIELFDVIENNCPDLEYLADSLKCDKNVLEVILNLLVKINLLSFDNNQYSNSKLATKYLTDKWNSNLSDLFLYNSISEFSDVNLIEKFFSKSTETKTNDNLERHMEAMHIGGRHVALSIGRKIKRENKKILDLGCGSGIFSISICKNNKTAKAHLIDREDVLKITQKNIEKENVSECMTCISSDILDFTSKEKYDYILYSNILHFYDVNTIKILLKKYYEYLNTDGKIFIYDTFNDSDNEYSLLYAMEWFAENICFIGVDRLPEMMKEIGYKNIILENTADSTRKLLIARR
jgi:2-polyprenyl-3-methyl-5-hydroxy-6-metoxy-1,4-benzoquinol methylase